MTLDDLIAGVLMDDEGNTTGTAAIISAGAPCRCGPGFCATREGVGHYGYCLPQQRESAPDCGACGAPGQSTEGCWLCPTSDAAFWLRCLREGVDGLMVFKAQDAALERGEALSLDEALDLVLAMKADA